MSKNQLFKKCFIIYNKTKNLYIMNEQLEISNQRNYAMEIHFIDKSKALEIARKANKKYNSNDYKCFSVSVPI